MFLRICPLCLSCQIYVYRVFVVFPYHSSDFCRVCSDVPCFIPDISDFPIFPFFSHFFFVNLINFFREPALCFFTFLLFFSFQFYWFLLFIVSFCSFHLSALGLFWFSLSSFLRWELRLLIWDFPSFPIFAINAIHFSRSTALVVSPKFRYAVSSFLFSPMHFLIKTWDIFFDPWIS